MLVLGCHIGECHYESGNHRAAKRIPVLSALMTFAGLEPQRLRLDWVSASEGERFSRIVSEFTEAVRALGPVQWRYPGRHAAIQAAGSLTDIQHLLQLAEESPVISDSGFRDQATKWQAYSQDIQSIARELLQNQSVDVVIGYETGPRGRARPVFVREVEQAQRLVWNQDCTHNLFVYVEDTLKRQKPAGDRKPAAAIVAKPCDVRSLNVLLAENRFERDQVHVIGVTCTGIRDGAGAGTYPGDQHWPLQDRCLDCAIHTPVIYDTLIGGTSTNEFPQQPSQPSASVKSTLVQALDRLEPFIRCYACRQACPLCYCPTCLFERDDSLWVGMGIGLNEKRTFHLGRAYHLAGRCIGCDECTRVCPMDIPVNLLNQKLAQEMQKLFAFQAGLERQPSPIHTVLGGEERAS